MSDRSIETPRLAPRAESPRAESARLEPLARLHEEVATRLRSVCLDMPAERFDALVREIVRVKLKYDTPPSPARVLPR